jgi:hypothetical protein
MGLAQAYTLAADFDDQFAGKAKDVAANGLKVDGNLAEAHFVLGTQVEQCEQNCFP